MTARLALLLLLALVARASGAWSVISSEVVSRTAGECHHVRSIVEDTESGDRAQIHLALFDSKRATLKVIDQPNEPRSALAETMEHHNSLAGTNGGYFEPDYTALGLLVSDGRVIAPLRKAGLLSGVLAVTNGRLRVQRVAEFSRKARPVDALQSGPFLVDRGRAVSGLNAERLARRTFIATDGATQAGLGYCSAVSLAQLARILATSDLVRDFTIERALNLDGGSSSAFWFRDGKRAFSIPEQKTVRNFVAVMPK
jgi:uncharacterized protein YigE (DUF2233 family)